MIFIILDIMPSKFKLKDSNSNHVLEKIQFAQLEMGHFKWLKMLQSGKPWTVLKKLESEEFKTVLGSPIWCILTEILLVKH